MTIPWAMIDSTKTTLIYDFNFVTTLYADLNELVKFVHHPTDRYIVNPFWHPAQNTNSVLHLSILYGKHFALIKQSKDDMLNAELGYNIKFQEQYESMWIYETDHVKAGITIQTYRLLICEK